jgi:polyhydroxyalkanoate synthesis regulator phasin
VATDETKLEIAKAVAEVIYHYVRQGEVTPEEVVEVVDALKNSFARTNALFKAAGKAEFIRKGIAPKDDWSSDDN